MDDCAYAALSPITVDDVEVADASVATLKVFCVEYDSPGVVLKTMGLLPVVPSPVVPPAATLALFPFCSIVCTKTPFCVS